jgi:hypothetical protein
MSIIVRYPFAAYSCKDSLQITHIISCFNGMYSDVSSQNASQASEHRFIVLKPGSHVDGTISEV